MTQTSSMDLVSAKLKLITVAHEAHARGWVPATSGNFSTRLADGDIAITVSGSNKGKLAVDDIMRLGADGSPRGSMQPSAETLLHVQLYHRDCAINAVLHTHSVNATIASQSHAERLHFEDLEILKAFTGIDTHIAAIEIPIFANNQNIGVLAEEVEEHMQARDQGLAYLIAGHGVYTWGADIEECSRHLEALEYLFEYHRLGGQGVVGNE